MTELTPEQKLNVQIYDTMKSLRRYTETRSMDSKKRRKMGSMHTHLAKASDIIEEYGGTLP